MAWGRVLLKWKTHVVVSGGLIGVFFDVQLQFKLPSGKLT
jgi:hypothetical protein